ncbi:MAG: hypothetical protein ACOYMF_05325 [Bacteroidales bacterium]
MEGRFEEDELMWIRDRLNDHGEYLEELLVQEIERKKLIQTSNLKDSIFYRQVDYGLDPALQFSFPTYGRAIEVQWHRSKNTRSLQEIKVNGIIVGSKVKSNLKKKDTRWYAKTAYGSINRLIKILLYEYDDIARERIKKHLEYKAKLNSHE